jgi:hypothetical protein
MSELAIIHPARLTAVPNDPTAFTVESTRLIAEADNNPCAWFGNRRTDNGEVLGVCTDSYGIIQNADLWSKAEEAFGNRSLNDFTVERSIANNGRKCFSTYTFGGSSLKQMNPLGGAFGLRITVQNSFDGTMRASFLVEAYRQVCSNGLWAFGAEVNVARKHTTNLELSAFDSAIEASERIYAKAIERYNQMEQYAISQRQGVNVFENLAAAKKLSGKQAERFTQVWDSPTYTEDKGRNLFNLYNAATQVITHDVRPRNIVSANLLNSTVFDAFGRILHGDDYLLADPVVDVSAN